MIIQSKYTKIFKSNNMTRLKYNDLPPQFLLSACRFISENGIPQQRIVSLFKEWMRYVVKFNNTDVNKLSYEQFFNLISQEKSKHCVPNVLFSNEFASLGKLNNAKDVQNIPVKNQWCIKSQKEKEREMNAPRPEYRYHCGSVPRRVDEIN